MYQLQQNTTLKGGEYKIIQTLGQGGFGITYLATQVNLNRKVAVKEFFMEKLCQRDATSRVTLGTEGSREMVERFKQKFLKEARSIASLNHRNIVRIHDVFEENGTAYYVMEYAEGGSLADKVKREGCLAESEATRYILRVAEALGYIHQRKMSHLDVKPSNIMLNAEGEPVLIDFGLAKQYDAETGGQTSSTPVGVSEGYAPLEQYRPGGVATFSPETDIYALGATYYKLLTGMTPPNASDVNEDGLPVEELRKRHVSDKAIAAISHAMEGRRKDRPKSVEAFVAGLRGASATPSSEKSDITEKAASSNSKPANPIAEETLPFGSSASHEPPSAGGQKPVAKKSNLKTYLISGMVGVVAVVGVIVGIRQSNNDVLDEVIPDSTAHVIPTSSEDELPQEECAGTIISGNYQYDKAAALNKESITAHAEVVPEAPTLRHSKQGFDIIAGFFTSKKSANKCANKCANQLKNLGIDAYIISKDGGYYVSMGSAPTYAEAEAMEKHIKSWYKGDVAIKNFNEYNYPQLPQKVQFKME